MLHICQVQKNPPPHHYEDLRSRKLETCPGLICERELSPHFFDHYIVEDDGDHHFLMVMTMILLTLLRFWRTTLVVEVGPVAVNQ